MPGVETDDRRQGAEFDQASSVAEGAAGDFVAAERQTYGAHRAERARGRHRSRLAWILLVTLPLAVCFAAPARVRARSISRPG